MMLPPSAEVQDAMISLKYTGAAVMGASEGVKGQALLAE
jgi:hypothetical protein